MKLCGKFSPRYLTGEQYKWLLVWGIVKKSTYECWEFWSSEPVKVYNGKRCVVIEQDKIKGSENTERIDNG